jgi:predicted dehydrogenase
MARWADTGVDRALVGSLDFAHGLFAQVSCSFATARHRRAFIVGEAGSIETTYYNDTSAQLPPTLIVRRGTGWHAKQETITTDAAAGFLAEAEAFADLVAHGWTRWPGATAEESIDIARMLDALAASAREQRTVELAN